MQLRLWQDNELMRKTSFKTINTIVESQLGALLPSTSSCSPITMWSLRIDPLPPLHQGLELNSWYLCLSSSGNDDYNRNRL